MVQQARAIRTRKAVLEAAAEVFDERGYAATSMAEVLARAQVTKGALYFHFASKEELAQAVIGAQAGFTDAGQDYTSPLQAVIDLSHRIARGLQRDVLLRAAIRLVIEQGSFTTPSPASYLLWIETLRNLLEEARGRHELLPHIDTNAAAETIVAAFTGIQLTDQVLTGRRDLPDKITTLWRLILPGLVGSERLPDFMPEGSAQHSSQGDRLFA